jgi:hypothetical protein
MIVFLPFAVCRLPIPQAKPYSGKNGNPPGEYPRSCIIARHLIIA